MFGYNVSDTMRSIRWLMEKHVKDVDMSATATVTVEKEPKPYGFMTSDIIINVLKLSAEGKRNKDVAKLTGLSPTTISNIVGKKGSYAKRPDDYDAIKAWFKNGHMHAKARKD
jgi:hypothetical protein